MVRIGCRSASIRSKTPRNVVKTVQLEGTVGCSRYPSYIGCTNSMGAANLGSMIRPGRRLLSSIVVVWWLAVPASAQTLFPTDGLEHRIDFWKQVFTKYGADDVIVHDRYYVDLIYAIADEDNAQRTIRNVKDGLLEIRDGLSSAAELSDPALKIRQAIVDAGLEPSASLLEELSDRIHTQRGVKERFRSGVIRSGRYVE